MLNSVSRIYVINLVNLYSCACVAKVEAIDKACINGGKKHNFKQ
jgi:hypothetical protein